MNSECRQERPSLKVMPENPSLPISKSVFALFTILLILITVLFYGLGSRFPISIIQSKDQSQLRSESNIKKFISQHESELIHYVKTLKINKISSVVSDLPPVIPDDHMKIVMVTADSNGNVYFSIESNVFIDYGFAYEVGNRPFLGDNASSRFTYLKEISGQWFVFSTR